MEASGVINVEDILYVTKEFLINECKVPSTVVNYGLKGEKKGTKYKWKSFSYLSERL